MDVANPRSVSLPRDVEVEVPPNETWELFLQGLLVVEGTRDGTAPEVWGSSPLLKRNLVVEVVAPGVNLCASNG